MHYSENNAQYLRVRILDGDKKFPANGGEILQETVGAGGARSDGNCNGRGRKAADGPQRLERRPWRGHATRHRSAFRVNAPPEFIRSVQISASADGKDWFGRCATLKFIATVRRTPSRNSLPCRCPHGSAEIALPASGNCKWQRRTIGRSSAEAVHHATTYRLRAAARTKLSADLRAGADRSRAVRSGTARGCRTNDRSGSRPAGSRRNKLRLGGSASMDRNARYFSVAGAAGCSDAARICGRAVVARGRQRRPEA